MILRVDRELNAAIGRAIREARIARGISRDYVGKYGEFNVSQLSRAESGRRGLMMSTFVRMCRTIEVDPADVLKRALQSLTL